MQLLCPQVQDQTRKAGICGVRENCEESLFSLVYGEVASGAVENIEPKPLYHYYPGSAAYSVGTSLVLKCLMIS